MQEEIKSRGIDAYQAFGTADLGLIAFETSAHEGMVVNEDLILETVRPGTGDPVAEGDVGEIVVTSLDLHHPRIRLALGDLNSVLPGRSPCGRSKAAPTRPPRSRACSCGPEQVAEIGRRHPELGRSRLSVTRQGETDAMTLKAECASPSEAVRSKVASTLQAVTKLQGTVELVAPGVLPNDGKVISDDRKPV